MVQVYPHHNDIGVWRVWEAGACLDKYRIQQPDTVWGRSIIEVGSGVGLKCLAVEGF